jgi:alpha-galactosidase
MNIAEKAAGIVHKGYAGSWPDLDSLEVGVGSMTLDEEMAHMSLWIIVKSPLMLGHDPTTM